ncbi:hypothetical protein [Bradyrhizobium sp. th.b2]|uniref:hypothetical protein n=1 Tax=Bradyrhizobium sp. th-b2 TaxID=172088 RepID=UPI000565F0BA|nr:hypothetical protein [Bradyrhizobium sp. th.b2]
MPELTINTPTHGNPDGRFARYCTVDDPLTGAGSGQIELSEHGALVTIFGRVCTQFTQKLFGDDNRIEAATSQVSQSLGTVSDAQPTVMITHTLFLRGTVQISGNIPTGQVVFRSPSVGLARGCGIQTYAPPSPGFVKPVVFLRSLDDVDPIGLITFSWNFGAPCLA